MDEVRLSWLGEGLSFDGQASDSRPVTSHRGVDAIAGVVTTHLIEPAGAR